MLTLDELPAYETFSVICDDVLYVADRWQVIAVPERGVFQRMLRPEHPAAAGKMQRWRPVPVWECGPQAVIVAHAYGFASEADVEEARVGSQVRLAGFTAQMRDHVQLLRDHVEQLRAIE